jgi:hypothetical protein
LAKAIGISQPKLSTLPTWSEILRKAEESQDEQRERYQGIGGDRAAPGLESLAENRAELIDLLPSALRQRVRTFNSDDWEEFVADAIKTAGLWEPPADRETQREKWRMFTEAWLDARRPRPAIGEGLPNREDKEQSDRWERFAVLEEALLDKLDPGACLRRRIASRQPFADEPPEGFQPEKIQEV